MSWTTMISRGLSFISSSIELTTKLQEPEEPHCVFGQNWPPKCRNRENHALPAWQVRRQVLCPMALQALNAELLVRNCPVPSAQWFPNACWSLHPLGKPVTVGIKRIFIGHKYPGTVNAARHTHLWYLSTCSERSLLQSYASVASRFSLWSSRSTPSWVLF